MAYTRSRRSGKAPLSWDTHHSAKSWNVLFSKFGVFKYTLKFLSAEAIRLNRSPISCSFSSSLVPLPMFFATIIATAPFFSMPNSSLLIALVTWAKRDRTSRSRLLMIGNSTPPDALKGLLMISQEFRTSSPISMPSLMTSTASSTSASVVASVSKAIITHTRADIAADGLPLSDSLLAWGNTVWTASVFTFPFWYIFSRFILRRKFQTIRLVTGFISYSVVWLIGPLTWPVSRPIFMIVTNLPLLTIRLNNDLQTI